MHDVNIGLSRYTSRTQRYAIGFGLGAGWLLTSGSDIVGVIFGAMVTAHTVVLLWFASSCGWMTACALSEVDLELQLADDWINLSDKKRRERKQQARQLLLSFLLVVLAGLSLSVWLAIPAALLFALAIYARSASARRSGPKLTQTLNVAGSSIEIAGPSLRAAISMLVAMGCLSVALGHIAGPWITAEVHEHLLSNSRAGVLEDIGDSRDVHGHVASRLAGSEEEIQNKHLRHLMHVHDVIRAHAANGTDVRRGIGHHMKMLRHVVGASAEVAKLIGKGVQHHVTAGAGLAGWWLVGSCRAAGRGLCSTS
jgi:hypothetical protein